MFTFIADFRPPVSANNTASAVQGHGDIDFVARGLQAQRNI